MCGRFFLTKDGLGRVLENDRLESKSSIAEFKPGTLYPGDKCPVIEGFQGGLRLDLVSWGYRHPRDSRLIINARSETIGSKRIFSRGFKNNRVAVPISGFYEWTKAKDKFTLSLEEDKLLYAAGIQDIFGTAKAFVILTTSSNASMKDIHPRMPLFLNENQVKDWIGGRDLDHILASMYPSLTRKADSYQQTFL